MIGPVLITGAAGQLGYELQRTVPSGVTVLAVDIAQLDLTNSAAVTAFIATHRPSVVINGAAYTAVDRAEEQPTIAHAVNVDAAASLATAAKQHDARMIQISTDFVFGPSTGVPRRTDDTPAPQSVYGQTKLDGERAVLDTLGRRALVVRTAWLYSAHGANFVKTMLRLMAERDELRIIADQIGTPTWANSLARTIWAAVAAPHVAGVLHWTDAGVASWYDFAVAIQEEGIARKQLTRAIPVHAISSAEFPTPAKRPAYSVLDKSDTMRALNVVPTHWRVNLRHMLDELAHA
jgi:dTDP-4-dehydrorhamnose reductase